MKRLVIILMLFAMGTVAKAEMVYVENDVTMANFWKKNEKNVEKIMEVGTHIIHANKIDKRIPIQMTKTPNSINASSHLWDKTIKISSGILPYIDNDDELAFVLGHETAHSIDAHDGLLKWVAMTVNTREYEYKADLIGIDLMVKAGYNPIAAITCANKWMGEEPFDLIFTHPVTSKRLMAMYKYIYLKYPWALKSDMIHNVNYENFTYSSAKEINKFINKQKQKNNNQEELL